MIVPFVSEIPDASFHSLRVCVPIEMGIYLCTGQKNTDRHDRRRLDRGIVDFAPVASQINWGEHGVLGDRADEDSHSAAAIPSGLEGTPRA